MDIQERKNFYYFLNLDDRIDYFHPRYARYSIKDRLFINIKQGLHHLYFWYKQLSLIFIFSFAIIFLMLNQLFLHYISISSFLSKCLLTIFFVLALFMIQSYFHKQQIQNSLTAKKNINLVSRSNPAMAPVLKASLMKKYGVHDKSVFDGQVRGDGREKRELKFEDQQRFSNRNSRMQKQQSPRFGFDGDGQNLYKKGNMFTKAMNFLSPFRKVISQPHPNSNFKTEKLQENVNKVLRQKHFQRYLDNYLISHSDYLHLTSKFFNWFRDNLCRNILQNFFANLHNLNKLLSRAQMYYHFQPNEKSGSNLIPLFTNEIFHFEKLLSYQLKLKNEAQNKLSFGSLNERIFREQITRDTFHKYQQLQESIGTNDPQIDIMFKKDLYHQVHEMIGTIKFLTIPRFQGKNMEQYVKRRLQEIVLNAKSLSDLSSRNGGDIVLNDVMIQGNSRWNFEYPTDSDIMAHLFCQLVDQGSVKTKWKGIIKQQSIMDENIFDVVLEKELRSKTFQIRGKMKILQVIQEQFEEPYYVMVHNGKIIPSLPGIKSFPCIAVNFLNTLEREERGVWKGIQFNEIIKFIFSA